MFLYETKFGDNPTFAPSYADTMAKETSQRAAADALWNTTRDLADYRDNSNAEDTALGEAYDQRNKAIFDATGVQLPNPRKDFTEQDMQAGSRILDAGGNPWQVMEGREADWKKKAEALARDKPQFSKVIGLDRPILDDAYAITRGAEQAAGAAEAQAQQSGLSPVKRLGASLGGGLVGSLRDPMQIGALAVGGGVSSPARALGWRLLESVFSEAAANGGIEAAVQLASHDYKQKAGVDASLSTGLKQVGLAALFGGGFGGLLEGGRTVGRLLGRDIPEEVLTRAASGNPEPGDFTTIADAIGVKPDPAMVRAADLAAEQPALDREAFGPPPDGLDEHEATVMAAQALRAADSPDDVRLAELTVARNADVRPPAPPVPADHIRLYHGGGGDLGDVSTLNDLWVTPHFEYARDYRRGAEPNNVWYVDVPEKQAAALGVKDEVNGYLINGKLPAEWARKVQPMPSEGRPPAETLAAAGFDLNRLSSEGQDVAAVMQAVPIEDAGRALQNQEIRYIEDRIAELSALTPTSNSYGPGLLRNQKAGPNDQVFEFGMGDALTKPEVAAQIRSQKDRLAELKGLAAKGEAHPDFIQQMEISRRVAAHEPLRQPNETPEPATPEAGEMAALTLTEARRPAAADAKPVDLDSGKKLSVWDAMPAAKSADGSILHATHETMIADADRTEFFGDLIAACKD